MIRVAGPGDVDIVHRLVEELAEYEREPGAVAMTPTDLTTALFGPLPAAHCLVATEHPTPTLTPTSASASAPAPADAGAGHAGPTAAPPVVGFALWHPTFSTWTGQSGMFLIDLFVRPEHRRAGHGRALLATLAAICADRGYSRLEWAILDWNTLAQSFYRSIGAAPMEGWTTWRLDATEITSLAGVRSPTAATGTA